MRATRGAGTTRSHSVAFLCALAVAAGVVAAPHVTAAASGPVSDTGGPPVHAQTSPMLVPGIAAWAAAGEGESLPGLAPRSAAASAAVIPATAERSTVIDEVTLVAVSGPDRGITVANLTVTPGQYYVGYTFSSRLESAYAPGELRCGLVDNNGVDHFIGDDPVQITSGSGWRQHRAITTLNVGDVTLGLRCDPLTVGLNRATFRDVNLWVVRMHYRD